MSSVFLAYCGHLNFYKVKTQRAAYVMLSHSLVFLENTIQSHSTIKVKTPAVMVLTAKF